MFDRVVNTHLEIMLLFTKYTIHNLGQKVGDKFTKLGKIGFSMEYFTADFLQFFNKKRQNLTFGWTAGYSPLNPYISRIFLKLPNLKLSESQFVRQLVRQLLHSLSGDNNLVSFHLW